MWDKAVSPGKKSRFPTVRRRYSIRRLDLAASGARHE